SEVVDIVHDGVRPLFLKQKGKVEIARVGWPGDPDEGNLRGSCAAGIVDGVADIERGFRYREQSIGRGLVAEDVLHSDDGGEGETAREPVQRKLGFRTRASREDGEAEGVSELFERAGTRNPLFAKDQAIRAIRAEEDRLKVFLYLFERRRGPDLGDGVMGEAPV